MHRYAVLYLAFFGVTGCTFSSDGFGDTGAGVAGGFAQGGGAQMGGEGGAQMGGEGGAQMGGEGGALPGSVQGCDPALLDRCYTAYLDACAQAPDQPGCVDLLSTCDRMQLACQQPVDCSCGGCNTCDPVAIDDCYMKYSTACAYAPPGEAQCDSLLRYCGELESSCQPVVEPNPCDVTTMDQCYTSYKESCAFTPDDAQCQELLKYCDELSSSCRVYPEPEPYPYPCDYVVLDQCYVDAENACASGDDTLCQAYLSKCSELELSCQP
jgi:hypothetical protein